MSGGRLGSQSVVRQSAVSRRLFYNFLYDILINLELLGPMLRHLDAISDYLGAWVHHGFCMAWAGGGVILTLGKGSHPPQPLRTDQDDLNESNEGHDRGLIIHLGIIRTPN